MRTTKSRASDIPNVTEPFVPDVHTVRGKRTVLDIDAALLYGLDVMKLRNAVAKNLNRFPEDFIVHLNGDEMNVHKAAYSFMPEGLAMLAAVLDTPLAVNGHVNMTRAFVMLDRLACSRGGL